MSAPAPRGAATMGRSRHGSPEGTRAGGSSGRGKGRRGRTGSLVAILCLSGIAAVAIGDQTARLTVENRTSHSMVVVVADKTFSNVRPGTRVTYESSATDTVTATVSYAPGEGVDGRAERTFVLSPSHGSSPGTPVYWACMVNTGVSDPNASLVVWGVTADMLAHP